MRRFLFLLIILAAVGYYFRADLQTWYTRIRGELEHIETFSYKDLLERLEERISLPAPLRGPREETVAVTLTAQGIFGETNRHRVENGLAPLTLNTKLAAAASVKTDDMFAQQYFAHESPSGVGPGDVIKDAGYAFIAVGENLILGNFKSDAELVKAWMDSPGHRANILNPKFKEIGIAVKRGIFEGGRTWIAVQEFGRPRSDCPAPDAALEARISANEEELDRRHAMLTAQRVELENTGPKHGPEYNARVAEYNANVKAYNELVEETKQFVIQFNAQIKTFNACVAA